MNTFVVKRGLVSGYKIGLQNNNNYIPVPDRDVKSFKKFKGEIEAIADGQRMKIKDWKYRITEETFNDYQNRGKYKIGYFLWKPMTQEEIDQEFSIQSL